MVDGILGVLAAKGLRWIVDDEDDADGGNNNVNLKPKKWLHQKIFLTILLLW